MLRLLNLMWLPKPCGRVVTPGPGFPSLEELCLAGSTCNFVSNEALGRLLHGSPNLRLLDLRGCARVTPAGLRDLPCQGQLSLGGGCVGGMWLPPARPTAHDHSPPPELEQLHLGLYGTSDRLTLAKEGSHLLTQKWRHTLRELDLSGQGFSEKDLEQALAAFSATPGGSPPALCSVNLRGTRVPPSTVRSASPSPVPWSQYSLPPRQAWLAAFGGPKGEHILAKPLLRMPLRDTMGAGLGPRWLWVAEPIVVPGQRGLLMLAWPCRGRGLLGAGGPSPHGLLCPSSSVISSCPGLLYLNLESCRCLPRGLKRAYRGQEEVQWCLEQLLTSLPSSS